MDQSAYDRLIDYLRDVYGDTLVEYKGHPYPALFFPAQNRSPNSVLSQEHPTDYTDRSFPVYERTHLNSRQQNRIMENKLTWVLDRLDTEPLQLSGKLGYYFDMIATCDAIDEELRAYAKGQRTDTPLRDKLHQTIPPQEALRSGAGRSAVIGVSTLIVFKQGNSYAALMGQRSDTVAIGAGLMHVVPAFVFQPSGSASLYAAEWSLELQMMREYGEELFSMPEYDDWPEQITRADYFHDFPAVAELRSLCADGRAELHLTGVAINLLTLRAEATLLLLIHDSAWYTNWQIYQSSHPQEAEHLHLHTFPLDAETPADSFRQMTPHGAVSYWSGIDLARRITGK